MNQFSLFLLFTLLLICTTSCDEMRQDMYFNSDGSGSIEFRMSMDGETIQMLMMMSASEDGVDEADLASPFGDVRDTTIVLYDVMPDSLKAELPEAEHLKEWSINFRSDSTDNSLAFNVNIGFNSLEEFRNTMSAFQEVLSDDVTSGMGASSFGNLIDTSFTWEPGHIYWKAADLSQNPEYRNMLEDMAGEDGEGALQMLEMFIGDLTFEMVIHTPGEVYKCICPFGEADGKKVTMSYRFMDVLNNLDSFNKDTHIYYRE